MGNACWTTWASGVDGTFLVGVEFFSSLESFWSFQMTRQNIKKMTNLIKHPEKNMKNCKLLCCGQNWGGVVVEFWLYWYVISALLEIATYFLPRIRHIFGILRVAQMCSFNHLNASSCSSSLPPPTSFPPAVFLCQLSNCKFFGTVTCFFTL